MSIPSSSGDSAVHRVREVTGLTLDAQIIDKELLYLVSQYHLADSDIRHHTERIVSIEQEIQRSELSRLLLTVNRDCGADSQLLNLTHDLELLKHSLTVDLWDRNTTQEEAVAYAAHLLANASGEHSHQLAAAHNRPAAHQSISLGDYTELKKVKRGLFTSHFIEDIYF